MPLNFPRDPPRPSSSSQHFGVTDQQYQRLTTVVQRAFDIVLWDRATSGDSEGYDADSLHPSVTDADEDEDPNTMTSKEKSAEMLKCMRSMCRKVSRCEKQLQTMVRADACQSAGNRG
jgi:hypothetical protein